MREQYSKKAPDLELCFCCLLFMCPWLRCLTSLNLRFSAVKWEDKAPITACCVETRNERQYASELDQLENATYLQSNNRRGNMRMALLWEQISHWP